MVWEARNCASCQSGRVKGVATTIGVARARQHVTHKSGTHCSLSSSKMGRSSFPGLYTSSITSGAAPAPPAPPPPPPAAAAAGPPAAAPAPAPPPAAAPLPSAASAPACVALALYGLEYGAGGKRFEHRRWGWVGGQQPDIVFPSQQPKPSI